MVHDTFVAKSVQKAISDEWFAHFQYWISSVIVGDGAKHVVDQFREHSIDEYDHATELALWLRHVPREAVLPYSMSELAKNQYCGYIYPSGNTVSNLILDTIAGERCTIDFYDAFLVDLDLEGRQYYGIEYRGNNIVDMIERILEKEKEHLRDLERLLEMF